MREVQHWALTDPLTCADATGAALLATTHTHTVPPPKHRIDRVPVAIVRLASRQTVMAHTGDMSAQATSAQTQST